MGPNRQSEVPIGELDLKDDPEILSPPYIVAPLYECATAVTVRGFVPLAELDLEVDGNVITERAGYPEPDGYTFVSVGPLKSGWMVRVRQRVNGIESGWSPEEFVRSHLEDYPAGPPRPEINPAPVYQCGSRTGVANLLTGCNVWIEADGVEVGRVDGAQAHQGINVNPDYGFHQNVIAFAELCGDPSPPSQSYFSDPPPSPLPAPGIDPIYEGTGQIRINNLINGARFTLIRNGGNIGTFRTWGYAHLVEISPATTTDSFQVSQEMCPGSGTPGGTVNVLPCFSLPAPDVAPIQYGATSITILWAASGASIKVFAGTQKIGDGGGSTILLTRPVQFGETVYVIQSVGDCTGATARRINPGCVAPPTAGNPVYFDLFPVGQSEYDDGAGVKGSVYYPADGDGIDTPFNRRLAALGTVPIVFMAHGNHSPADPSYRGYDYFQNQLASMGIIAVSVDCNAFNGNIPLSVSNIIDRSNLILRSIAHFQGLHNGGAAIFGGRIDFGRVGLMGHSRGAEAVISAGNDAPGVLGVQIRAVISLAPTDTGFLTPQNYAYMTILPAGDGDVAQNNGAKFYDMAAPSPFKSQVYIHFANHNWFNRQWASNDGFPTASIMARFEHERILSAYGAALYRAFLLGHATTGYLTYHLLPDGVRTEQIYLSYELQEQMTVDHHEDGNGIGVNSLNQPTAQMNGLAADEFRFAKPPAPNRFNSSFYGDTMGMVAQTQKQDGTFRSQLNGAVDMTDPGLEIWLRTAEVYDGRSLSIPPNAPGFELGLESANGAQAWVDGDLVGGLPRPYVYPLHPWWGDVMKTMLSTLRFRPECFAASQPELELKEIVAILIRLNRLDSPPIAFDVLQIVRQ